MSADVPSPDDAPARHDVTGLVLAGGRSRRFGRDKAHYHVEGRPMVDRVAATLAEVASTVLVSVRTPGEEAEWPGRLVADRYPGAGPLAGLQAGLRAASTPWVLVVACDMPFVTPRGLRQLVAAIAPGVQAVVAEGQGGRRQPLCACYHRSLEPLASSMLDAGERAVHRFVTQVDPARGLRTVRLPDGALRNINRPGDLEG